MVKVLLFVGIYIVLVEGE